MNISELRRHCRSVRDSATYTHDYTSEDIKKILEWSADEIERLMKVVDELKDILQDASNRLHHYSQDNKHAEVTRLIEARDRYKTALGKISKAGTSEYAWSSLQQMARDALVSV